VTDLGPVGASSLDRFEQHLIAGGELLRQNRLPDAQRELLAALELAPDSAKALALLGLAYFRGGRFAEALPVYRRLVATTPSDASYHLNLGLVLLKLGDSLAAASALERSRDLDPSQGRAVSYLGLAYARGGRFLDAYQAFLLAGQADLAREISENLSPAERGAIESNLRRAAAPDALPVVAADAPVPTESSRFVARGLHASSADDDDLADDEPPAIVAETQSSIDALAEVRAEQRAEAVAAQPADDDSAFDAIEALDAVAPPTATPTPAPVVAPADPVDGPASTTPVSRNVPRRTTTPSRPPPPPAPARAGDLDEDGLDEFGSIDGVVEEVAHGAISRAVAIAAPSGHGVNGRVAAGNRPPKPLSEFATTRLVRLEDGEEPFEISAGGVLIVRVSDKMFSRTEGVDVSGGQLSYEPALRRSRGQNRAEPFATGGRPMFAVTGKGHLIAAPLGGAFTAVSLDDDIFYLREDLVFAFEPALRWENGHVPGSRERISIVQFRGSGAVAFRTERPLLSVKLAQERVLYVDATALAGWIGRVVPRAVTPADGGPGSELFVECTGEGVVLVEEEQAPTRAAT